MNYEYSYDTSVMIKFVTAIVLIVRLLNGVSTCRTALLAAPTDEQKEAGTRIRRKLFLMNRRALCD